MPLGDCGGEGGREGSKNGRGVHSSGIVSVHAGTEGLGGSDALGIGVVHGIIRGLVGHGDIAVEGRDVHPSIGHERVVRVFG